MISNFRRWSCVEIRGEEGWAETLGLSCAVHCQVRTRQISFSSWLQIWSHKLASKLRPLARVHEGSNWRTLCEDLREVRGNIAAICSNDIAPAYGAAELEILRSSCMLTRLHGLTASEMLRTRRMCWVWVWVVRKQGHPEPFPTQSVQSSLISQSEQVHFKDDDGWIQRAYATELQNVLSRVLRPCPLLRTKWLESWDGVHHCM